MKKLIMLLFFIALVTGLYAQNTFFASKAGAELTYAEKNAKGKVTNYSKLTIKSVQGSGRNMTILYDAEALDKNKKPLKNSKAVPLTIVIKDNVMTLDMMEMFIGALLYGSE